MLELYERLCQLLGYQGELAYGPRRPGDIQRMALAIERAVDELGWEPPISLSEGLKELVGQSDLERHGGGGS